jgi:hypothetical protein
MTGCRKCYLRIPHRHIANFQFIIEDCDGVAAVSAVDTYQVRLSALKRTVLQ